MGSDIANMDIKVYIFCKGAKNENLIKKVFGYYNALYALIRTNENLDNFVEFTKITNMDFYPAVSANGSITGIETTLNIQWINWTNGEV